MSRSRILIVEDNALNLQLVRDILEYRGHEIYAAGTVGECRVYLGTLLPDLILLDVQIPGGGGELLLKEIRNNNDYAAVPIIAVTALAMSSDRERLLQAGFDGYISKPIDTRSFGPEIETYLNVRGRVDGG